MKTQAMLTLMLAAASLSCAELETKRETPRHPDVAVKYTVPTEVDPADTETLTSALRALQHFHGIEPSLPYRVAAATGSARMVAAHPIACAAEWIRGGRALGLTAAGPLVGLELQTLSDNAWQEDPDASAMEAVKQRRNHFVSEHQQAMLAELVAGRPVLALAGLEGGIADWGVITRYESTNDRFLGHRAGTAAESSLEFPPQHVVLVRPGKAPPSTDDLALLRHAIEAARKHGTGPDTDEASWRFGLAAVDVWRQRMARIPFCKFCHAGSWQCHQSAARTVIRSLRRAGELVAAAPLPEGAVALGGELQAALTSAAETLAGSAEDAIEARFQDKPGQREVAADLIRLRKALELTDRLEAELLTRLDGPAPAP